MATGSVINQRPKGSKVFNDSIHGNIVLHPLLVRIINTPQFNRLRNIKQMGGVYYVYPGACHNRFDHSIGVAYLAGKLVQVLRKQRPKLPISDRDELCVQIAGLCHDLGHGPFSHLFDEMFMKKMHPELNWTHEKASVDMFDYMIEENSLREVMEEHGLMLSEDLEFIKEQIAGPVQAAELPDRPAWPYNGRPESKSFLYDIVANKRNGIDVDKMDYFARDCHHLGIQNMFDYKRFLKFARVCEVDGRRQICTRDNEVHNLSYLYSTRHHIHLSACQHRVVYIIQKMIAEAFQKADRCIQIQGSDGQPYKISTAYQNMGAYTRLTDQVFDDILNSTEENLAEARAILKNVVTRKHYKLVFQKWRPDTTEQVTIRKHLTAAGLKRRDFIIDEINMDCGTEEDPINRMRFYSKDRPQIGKRLHEHEVSKICHQRYAEKVLRVCCKKDEILNDARIVFQGYNPAAYAAAADEDDDDDDDDADADAAP